MNPPAAESPSGSPRPMTPRSDPLASPSPAVRAVTPQKPPPVQTGALPELLSAPTVDESVYMISKPANKAKPVELPDFAALLGEQSDGKVTSLALWQDSAAR